MTSSDATTAYSGPATITLSATDALSGVAATYHRVNGGPVMSGSVVTISAAGTHTVEYWSEDVAGNSESANSVTFAIGKLFLRVEGMTRYDTAVEISRKTFATGTCNAVIIATGRNFPDALAAGSLAGVLQCPIILVDGKGTVLEAKQRDEIRRLTQGQSTYDVYIMGGTLAVSSAVETSLKSQLRGVRVTRVFGATRYDTGIAIARKMREKIGAPLPNAFIATGVEFADALIASPAAFRVKMPILLTDNRAANIDKVKAAAVEIGVQNASLVASTTTLTEATRLALDAALPGSCTRVASASSPYRMSVDFATWFESSALGPPRWHVIGIANGQGYPDALAAGPMQGMVGSLIMLTPREALDPSVEAKLIERKDEIWEVRFCGGDRALNPPVRDATRAALR